MLAGLPALRVFLPARRPFAAKTGPASWKGMLRQETPSSWRESDRMISSLNACRSSSSSRFSSSSAPFRRKDWASKLERYATARNAIKLERIRSDDILVECLQVFQLFAFFFQLGALSPQRLGQQVGKVCYGKKRHQVGENPYPQLPFARHGARHAGNALVIRQLHQRSQQDKAQPGHHVGVAPREQHAGDNNRQQVERDEVAFVPAARPQS